MPGLIRKIYLRFERLVFGRRAYKFLIKDWTSLGDLQRCADAIGSMRFSDNLEPLLMDRPVGRQLLVIAPHADDEMIGPGGTVLKALDAGCDCTVLYLTRPDGEAGNQRIAETRSVAELVGYQTEFLDFSEGKINVAVAGKLLTKLVVDLRPDIVMVPFLTDDHADHRKASEVLMAAVARLPARVSPEIWAYQVYSALVPNVIVDITTVAERKADCIRMWRKSAMRHRDWSHYALGLNAYNTRFLPEARNPRYAEMFLVLPLNEYVTLCRSYLPVDSRAAPKQTVEACG